MKKQETFSIRYFARKSRGAKEGQSPISLRVTINTERVEISLGTLTCPVYSTVDSRIGLCHKSHTSVKFTSN